MYKIGVIGDRADVSGFIALGYSVCDVSNAEEAKNALKTLVKYGEGDESADKYAIIFITEKYASLLSEEIAHYSSRPLPAITSLPESAADGGMSFGMRKLKSHVEKAVGTDILFRDS
ncbi:MAG: V-type ATP synthase subunit F [Firmicutes bacterium]|nr:V-type ATP synthase subunit F [Bacillota bacterium]